MTTRSIRNNGNTLVVFENEPPPSVGDDILVDGKPTKVADVWLPRSASFALVTPIPPPKTTSKERHMRQNIDQIILDFIGKGAKSAGDVFHAGIVRTLNGHPYTDKAVSTHMKEMSDKGLLIRDRETRTQSGRQRTVWIYRLPMAKTSGMFVDKEVPSALSRAPENVVAPTPIQEEIAAEARTFRKKTILGAVRDLQNAILPFLNDDSLEIRLSAKTLEVELLVVHREPLL